MTVEIIEYEIMAIGFFVILKDFVLDSKTLKILI